MATILEALKNKDFNLRVSNTNDRWLYRDEIGNYVVCERKSYARRTTVVYTGTDEEKAVACLTGESKG